VLWCVVAATVALVGVPAAARASSVSIEYFAAHVSDMNQITLEWRVSGANAARTINISGLGAQPQACPGRRPAGCSTSLRVGAGGIYRYTLSVRNDADRIATSMIEVLVPAPAPPSTPGPRVDVDMLHIRAQTLSWSHAGSGFVQLYPPDSLRPSRVRFPATGTFTVRDLPIGTSTFTLSYCEQPAVHAVPLCSSGTPVSYVVGPAEFAGPFRRFVSVHQALPLSWSGSGNVWLLSAPSLGVTTWLTTPRFTIPAADMTAGVHEISVVSCTFSASSPRCANRYDLRAEHAGSVQFTAASGTTVTAGQIVGRIAPDGAGPTETLIASRDGVLHRLVANGAQVGPHVAAAMVITADVGRTEVVAGGGASVPTWTTTNWQHVFAARTYDDAVRPATGEPLDITFDAAGGIWQVGEFSQAIAHAQGNTLTDDVSPVASDPNPVSGTDVSVGEFAATISPSSDGALTVADMGVDRAAGTAADRARSTKPYAMDMFGLDVGSSTSALGERVIDTGSAVWYTQGGELFYNGIHANHSTLIKVTYRNGHASSVAPDGGVCAIAVPGDNNQVIGIAYDRSTNRVWFTESHAGRTSALDWFVDDGSIPCDNHLNYSNPNDVAAVAAANHCTSATQTGCIHQIVLPASAGTAGHLTIDPSNGDVWFVDFSGRVLDRYPHNGGAVQSFPLPASVSPSMFNGFPWQIQVDANAVYLNEYSDNMLLRFDKTVADPTTRCVTLTDGMNPCIAELFLPMPGPDTYAHSIALVGHKLWFTIANESDGPTDPNGSTFGYLDTASWAAGAPTGTYFDDFTTLGTAPPNAHHCFRGIAVTASGNVAIADSGYDQIDSLTPK